MEQYQNTFDAIHASESLKRRMVSLMLEQNVPRACRTEQQTRRSTIPAKRKALLIAIAAILLLFSACAAYAIYWSSTQRAIHDATENIEKPADTVLQEAESYAEGVVKASSLTAPLSGSATVGDVTIQLVSVEVFQELEGGEYVFFFSARSEKTGFITWFDPTWMEDDRAAQERLKQYGSFCEIGIDARDFVLSIDGQAFSPYAKPDDHGIRLRPSDPRFRLRRRRGSHPPLVRPELRFQRTRQHLGGPPHLHPRTGRDRQEDHGVRRRDRLGRREAGRTARQDFRRGPPTRARIVLRHLAGRRPAPHRPMVLEGPPRRDRPALA